MNKLGLLICLLLLPACSVKEERAYCPCVLRLAFKASDIGKFASSRTCVLVSGDLAEAVELGRDEMAAGYVTKVPRSGVGVVVTTGCEGFPLLIQNGEECPPVYAHVLRHADTDCDEFCDSVVFHKQYCEIELKMSFEEEGKYPFDVTIEGTTALIDTYGEPVRGKSSVTRRPDGDGRMAVRVPRQTDDGLLLVISSLDGSLRTFRLGEALAASGYDWEAEDLADVSISISYSRLGLSIDFDLWSDNHHYDINV